MDRQKLASTCIGNMSECQRDTFQLLEDMKKSPAEMYVDSRGKYRKDMTGMFKCHLRVLSNVSKAAAVEAMNLKIKHDQTERALDVLKNHVDGINGNIFHLRKIHWVALIKVSGSDEAIYFDDMVLMHMKNYEGSLAALNMLETMSSHEYSKVFPAQICPPVLTVPPQSESERKKNALVPKEAKIYISC